MYSMFCFSGKLFWIWNMTCNIYIFLLEMDIMTKCIYQGDHFPPKINLWWREKLITLCWPEIWLWIKAKCTFKLLKKHKKYFKCRFFAWNSSSWKITAGWIQLCPVCLTIWGHLFTLIYVIYFSLKKGEDEKTADLLGTSYQSSHRYAFSRLLPVWSIQKNR